MINIKDLGLKNIRREIDIVINGEERTILIFNPVGEMRTQLLNLFIKENKEGYEAVNNIEEVYITVLRELTNLEIEEDIDLNELFNRPSYELIEIRQEINNILNEIQLEFWYEQLNKIDKAKELYLLELVMKKANELQDLAKSEINK